MERKSCLSFKGSQNMLRSMESILELVALMLLYYCVWRQGYADVDFPQYLGYGKFVLMGVYVALVIILFRSFDGFKFGYLRLTDIVVGQWIALLIVNAITYFQLCLIANVMISLWEMLALLVLQWVIAVVLPYGYTALHHRLYSAHRMIMVYDKDTAVTLKRKMESRPDKYRIHKLVSIEQGLETVCREISGFDTVILNDLPAAIRNDILKYCYDRGIRTYVTPKLSDIIVRGADDICLFDTPLLLVRGAGLTLMQRVLKRTMDIILCLAAMTIALPFMLIVALAIKLDDGGPVFYKQKRATWNGKTFNILKFRSMIVNAEKLGISQPATDNDPRITRVGKIIRATRLDELPQILNILKGDMSIVGPRPERLEHVEKYSAEIPEFNYRLKVKGGLTGYAQIYGKYNTTAYDKLRLDLMYIENYSIFLDIKLILMTIRILFKKESTEGFVLHQEEKMDTEKEEALTGGR